MSTIEILACDLDGTRHTDEDPVSTVEWGLDDALYEIDVCARHELELREVLERHALAGRKAGATTTAKPRTAAAAGSVRQRNQRIREWAREHGFDVLDRGRLSGAAIAAYEEAHR